MALVEGRPADPAAAMPGILLAKISDAQHPTSTCRLGPSNSATTVVDPELRVLGVEGLRVADASVFPFCPRANTNLATIAVGELAADLLGGRA